MGEVSAVIFIAPFTVRPLHDKTKTHTVARKQKGKRGHILYLPPSMLSNPGLVPELPDSKFSCWPPGRPPLATDGQLSTAVVWDSLSFHTLQLGKMNLTQRPENQHMPPTPLPQSQLAAISKAVAGAYNGNQARAVRSWGVGFFLDLWT